MIYLDHHATTPCDRRVVEAMLPWMTETFGNPHSDHAMGRQAAEAIDRSLGDIASVVGAPADSVVVTSGATEANNLAIRGLCQHPRQTRRHVVSVVTEHPSVLDVLDVLKRDGFRITLLPVDSLGQLDLDQLADTINDDTALVSVMAANNEIGTLAPMRKVAEICHSHGALLHSDATQTLGRLHFDMAGTDVDMVSFSAHKGYGPKGVGFLVAGNGNRRVRLMPQIVGGGQQRNLRSGTLNPAAIVGMAMAVSLADQELEADRMKIGLLCDQLWQGLCGAIEGLTLNGMPWGSEERLLGNLSFSVPRIQGDAWMTATPDVAFSTGSACSNAKADPSHVLIAAGLSESMARQSVRLGVGRGNASAQIEQAIALLVNSFERVSSHL